tara:strand:- start:197 stop:565 length:369 start_codon:yes stop_codon:yes gene_type:complete
MEQTTVVNYQFIDSDPDITKYLPKFIEGNNNKILNKNLINTQVGFLDSAACKNANEPINVEAEIKKKENFSDKNKENMNPQSSTFTNIIYWVSIAFIIIIFGLFILGFTGVIDWDFHNLIIY